MQDEPIQLVHGALGRIPAKVPCVECPLRRDANPGALGGWTPTMYLTALHGPADIACHLSKGFGSDLSKQRSCAGVAAYRASLNVTSAHPLSHARAASDYVRGLGAGGDRRALDMCFDSPNAFMLHHAVPEGEAAQWWVLPKGRDENTPCGQGGDE